MAVSISREFLRRLPTVAPVPTTGTIATFGETAAASSGEVPLFDP
jgi:hypothetical protein